MVTELTPTKRAAIWPTYVCPMKCSFCYEKFREVKEHRSFEDVRKEMDTYLAKGINFFDCSGGEPTLYPHITDFIKYALSKNAKTCLITSAIAGENTVKTILESGVADFLVSIHGLRDTHNKVVGVPNARDLQIRFMKQVMDKMRFRMNCVITKNNQDEIVELAKWMVQFKPYIVNFINFQPLRDWKDHSEDASKVIADLRVLEPNLNEAIKILEDNGCGVNVRYYPMCRIAEQYRRCVCSDFAVPFDPYEWIYDMDPNDLKGCIAWGKKTSIMNEEKGEPCCRCDLQWICGGVNKSVNQITNQAMVDPIVNTGIVNKQDFYYYRRNNVLTLKV